MHINPEDEMVKRQRQTSSILKPVTFLIGILLLAVFAVPSVSAQKFSGQLTGTVSDQQGAAIPDATVTVTQPATGVVRTVMTSGDGNYSIPDLPIGVYRINVTKSGFKATVAENVTINVSSVTRQDISLSIGASARS